MVGLADERQRQSRGIGVVNAYMRDDVCTEEAVQ